MDGSVFGIVIKVKNLENTRSFYRDILQLGDPVMDSNFWVEFKLCSSVSLCLEKVPWDAELEPESGRVTWLLDVPDMDKFSRRMAQYGYTGELTGSDCFGFAVKKFRDPEGNPFLVTEKKDSCK